MGNNTNGVISVDYRSRFIEYFYNYLFEPDWFGNSSRIGGLFDAMELTKESNKWHRERNVLVHTNMVVAQYLSLTNSIWTKEDFLGAIALVFHDVGKPIVAVHKETVERGQYISFAGHELMSARKWEDFASRHWAELSEIMYVEDLCKVTWLIENHLPWKIKISDKLLRLARTAVSMFKDTTVFTRVLWADQLGRISDDRERKIAEIGDWINSFEDYLEEAIKMQKETEVVNKICYIPIAPSGAGKTTFRQELLTQEMNKDMLVHSMDDLRLQFYSNDYAEAFRLSTEDSDFSNKVQKDFIEKVKTGNNLYIDNTNLSKKRRNFYVAEARKRGYYIVAILFPCELDVLVQRQSTRGDKHVDQSVVARQYNALQMPSIGEVDCIIVKDYNLS